MAAVVNGAVNNITTCNPFTETELTWLSGVRGVAGSVCLVLILLILLLHRSWKGRSPNNGSEITPSRAHDDLILIVVSSSTLELSHPANINTVPYTGSLKPICSSNRASCDL